MAASLIGFDFGIRPKVTLIGDLKFADYFQSANCVGLSYAFDRDPTSDNAIPSNLFFMFEKESPAIKFFDSLERWIGESGNDVNAVDLTFIEDTDGGYSLAIGQEAQRFMKKMTPEHMTGRITPNILLLTQFKKIPILGRNYFLFKRNYARAKHILIGYAILGPAGEMKYSKRFFERKEFFFSSESVVNFNIATQTYEALKKPLLKSQAGKPPIDTIDEINARRESMIKELLPITYHKLSTLWLGNLVEHFQRYKKDIFWQAACNLIVTERIKKSHEWVTMNDSRAESSYKRLNYLLLTYESFASFFPETSFFTIENIETQINEDQHELKRYLENE